MNEYFLVISRTDQLSTTYPASTNKGISNFYPPKFPMTKYALCDAKPQTAGGTPTTKLTYVPPKLSPWCMDGHNFEITPGMGVSIDKTTGIVPPVSPAYSGAYGTQTDRRVLGVVKNIWSLSEYYGGEGLGQYENYPQALKTAKEHADVHVGASLFEGYLGIVRILLDGGADINAVNEEGFTALLAAASNGYLEVVNYLTYRGAKSETVDSRNNFVTS